MKVVTEHETQARIRAYIVENFLLGSDEGIDAGASLLQSGVLDSTGVMEVVDFLEETYSITIGPEELTVENLDSLERIARFVEGKQREAA